MHQQPGDRGDGFHDFHCESLGSDRNAHGGAHWQADCFQRKYLIGPVPVALPEMIDIDVPTAKRRSIVAHGVALAAITGQALRVHKVRAKRANRAGTQHLAAVKAVAALCGAEAEGLQAQSQEIVFQPARLRAGISSSTLAPPAASRWCCRPCCRWR